MINTKPKSDENELDEIKHIQAFSDLTTHPEDLLSDWIDVSGLMLTTSILFYHMSRSKTLKVDPRLAKLVAISLILISTLYLVYGLMTYTHRMNDTVQKCREHTKCTDKQANKINNIKNTYIGIGVFTVLTQALIVYIVLSTI
jgi:hypothetical protein